MYADTRMTAERERNVRIVLYILKITRRKALWIEFLRVVPVVTMVMKNISVHHDARFGGNVKAPMIMLSFAMRVIAGSGGCRRRASLIVCSRYLSLARSS